MTEVRDPVAAGLEQAVAQGWMPGATWWIEDVAGVRSRGAVGRRSADPESPLTTVATPYDLASLTKPLVTALLMVMHAREGRLDLDQPLGQQLAALSGSRYADATPRQAAAHVAGFPAWRPLYLAANDVDEYLGRIATYAPTCPPGTVVYSDLGYIVLGRLLEVVGGARLDVQFDERLARPLGLSDSGFAGQRLFPGAAPTEEGNQFERRLAGEAGADHGWREQIPAGQVHDGNAYGLGGVAGHAGLFGVVEDVARIVREMLEPRKLPLGSIGRSWLLEELDGAPGRTLGFQTARASTAARGVFPARSPGHTGFTGTSVWLDPARRGVAVLLTNRVHPRVDRQRNFQRLRRGFHRLAVSLWPRDLECA